MKQKKILIIQESAKGGGAEKVLIDMLRYFDRTLYDVTLLLINAYGIHLSDISNEVKCIYVNKHSPNLLLRGVNHFSLLRDILLKYKIKKLIKGQQYDTIISFMEGPATKVHSFITDHAIKNISWVHVNLLVNHWSAFVYRNHLEEQAVYKKMDSIVLVSQGVKHAFSKLFGITENLRVIYNVIDFQTINQKATEFIPIKNKFTICNIGRLTEQKRHDRLIAVAKILKEKGIEFEIWILGEGKLESQLRNQVNMLNVADVVKFLGYQTNPYPYIKASDIFVLTSDTEGYPTVVCEALCLGKPVISTNITGADELLANGVGILTGFDPYDIAEQISKLVLSKDLYSHYADLATRRGLQFCPQDVMNQIYSLL